MEMAIAGIRRRHLMICNSESTKSGLSCLIFELRSAAGRPMLNQRLARRTRLMKTFIRRGSIGGTWATGMPALTENLSEDGSIAAAHAYASGINQMVVLAVIERASLKAMLAWYL